MKHPKLVAFGSAALVVIAAIGIVWYLARGSHLELRGSILKVRTAPTDENSSVAVVDFRVNNVADYEFNVLNVKVVVEEKSGNKVEGMTVSEVDARHLFEVLPLLGQKYNDSLVVRNRLPPHATEDRMIAASFPIPESRLDMRQGIVLRVEEVEGNVSEIKGK
jgi:hypothetical protein